MEASEKPQLPLDSKGESVRAIDDRLVIERLEVQDAGAARVVREQAKKKRPPAETVSRAIEIGARLIESEGTAANVDFVNAQFERQMGKLSVQLGELLESGSEELAEHIASTFGVDRAGSVQQQIREMLVKANEHQRTELARLFNAEDGANPLADFKTSVTSKVADAAQRSERQAEALREAHTREAKEMRDQIGALRTEIARLTERQGGDELLQAAEEAGTRKGRSFEDRVGDALERIALGRGDAALRVGDEAGAGGSKKGDIVVEVGGGEGPPLGRVVFEAKDSRLSRPKAWEELNGALMARGASFAVLVVAGEGNLPPEREQLHEYEGNKLIVAVDPEDPDDNCLDAAYRFARLRVLLSRESELTVDAAGVRDAAAEARGALDALKTIKSALSKATNNMDQARGAAETMVAAVLDRLERIESLIDVAEE